MLAFLLAPLYLLACYYIFRHSLRWMQSCTGICHSRPFKIIYVTIFALLAFSPVIGFTLPESQFQRVIQIASSFWMGLFLYSIMIVFVTDIVFLILKRSGALAKQDPLQAQRRLALLGGIITVLIIGICTYGTVHSKVINETNYSVKIDKPCKKNKNLNIVLIADMHLGYNMGLKQVDKMVDMINDMDADLVCFAGDIFNNDYDAIKYPDKIIKSLKNIKSTYGSYACYGNHDIDEPILSGFTFTFGKAKANAASDIRMDDFLKKSNIRLLSDSSLLINDSFYLIGRVDREKPGKTTKKGKSPAALTENLDKSKPIIMLDHEPNEFQEVSDAGVDLDLSGHTHDGQFFPLNISSKIMWDNSAGMIKVDDMTSVVTSGIGTYGPSMRICTDSEIVKVKVAFKSNKQ